MTLLQAKEKVKGKAKNERMTESNTRVPKVRDTLSEEVGSETGLPLLFISVILSEE